MCVCVCSGEEKIVNLKPFSPIQLVLGPYLDVNVTSFMDCWTGNEVENVVSSTGR